MHQWIWHVFLVCPSNIIFLLWSSKDDRLNLTSLGYFVILGFVMTTFQTRIVCMPWTLHIILKQRSHLGHNDFKR
jgi:hypothetical protein